MRTAILGFVTAFAVFIAACSSSPSSTPTPDSSTTQSTSAPTTSTPSTTSAAQPNVLVSFPTAESTEDWINVDDSVMGGISASESTWVTSGTSGALLFTGILSTESNGGFASTLGPTDVTMGSRATGASALRVSAVGDGRTYLLQLRAGRNGSERWVARFTPPSSSGPARSSDSVVTIPITTFEAVDRFLRPDPTSSSLDPSTILQIGVYVLDAQVGEFRLQLQSVDSVR